MKPSSLAFPPLLALAIAFSALLAGCGDNGMAPPPAPSRITGHVSNDDGPVDKARIEAKDAKGQLVEKTELQAGSNNYRIVLPVGTAYPVILTAYPEGTGETLKAAVSSPLAAEQDISPVSTIIVDTALGLGGINEANLAKAAGAAISLRRKSGSGGGGGATTESFKGDPSKQYGGWH